MDTGTNIWGHESQTCGAVMHFNSIGSIDAAGYIAYPSALNQNAHMATSLWQTRQPADPDT